MLIVSAFSPNGEALYGRRMVETFHEFWPPEVELVVYVERPTVLPRGQARMLHDIPGWTEFHARWKDDPKARGYMRSKYSYRWDAVKFARVAYMAWDAAERMGDGVMAWFDGDTYSHNFVPSGFIESLLGKHDCCYLGRTRTHAETGFVGYRLPKALGFIKRWRDFYDSGEFRNFPEWHSAYLWQEAVKQTGVAALDLTRSKENQVWDFSPLAPYTVHLKGERKYRC